MITINVVCVGLLKEKYWVDAINEYKKRLSAFCNFNIYEVKEGLVAKTEGEILIAKKQESNYLSKYKKGYCIALEINGKQLSSEQFADKIKSLSNLGKSEITFFIGGSNGIEEEFSKSLDYQISFGKLTYPHQLMRVVLTEQIYRAFMIINNRSYHK